ncbi:MAG: DNA repair protein RecO [Patescibacteria group bacterium]|jgi:DNA repair protein RecO
MSWSTQKTEAIILAVYPNREADRWYRALTPDFGKIEFTGRGAQKREAKLASHLEPFAIVDLEVVRGRRSTTVISVERRHDFYWVRTQLEQRLLAVASATFVNRYTKEEASDAALYHFFSDWLSFLDRDFLLTPAENSVLLAAFLLRLLTRLGYDIDFSHCLSCRKSVESLECRWHGGRGGLVCSSCANIDSRDWFASREVGNYALKFLRCLKQESYENLLHQPIDREILEQAALVIHDAVLCHIPTYDETPFWQALLPREWLENQQGKL